MATSKKEKRSGWWSSQNKKAEIKCFRQDFLAECTLTELTNISSPCSLLRFTAQPVKLHCASSNALHLFVSISVVNVTSSRWVLSPWALLIPYNWSRFLAHQLGATAEYRSPATTARRTTTTSDAPEMAELPVCTSQSKGQPRLNLVLFCTLC